MTEAFIYDHVRTPRGRGRQDGALHEVTALELSTQTLKALRDRNALDTKLVDDVILGIVEPIGEQGGDLPRMAAICADYATSVPGVQINRFCSSGLEAVNFAASQVIAGVDDLVVAGGVESMSRVPMGSSGYVWAQDPQIAIKSYFMPQGIAADLIATKFGFSRDDVDAYAVESHKRALVAQTEGRFDRSIIPVVDINGLPILSKDEGIRANTNMQSLAQLNAAFEMMGEMGGFDAVAIQSHPEVENIKHVHHAGNSSQITDGAAAVLVGNAEGGQKASLKPRARIKAYAHIGSDLGLQLTGPVDVTRKVLQKARMKISDIEIFEVNEAFSSIAMRFIQAFELDPSRINVNGGAIAMGHPLGATGAMLLGTLLDEMERRNLSIGLATLCVGAGMGSAAIIERL